MLRPAGFNLIGGSLPASQSFTPSTYHSSITTDHARRQSALQSKGGPILAFGDSNGAGTAFGEIPFVENCCIAGDTLPGLIYRLRGGNYGSLVNGRATLLLNYPFNDICVASPNLATIESMYASVMSYFTGPLVILPPTRTSTSAWNTNIGTFNGWLASTYSSREQCEIVDISDLQTEGGAARDGDTTDGQHWSASMQAILVARVAAALRLV